MPFAFIVIQSFKTGPEAANLDFTWPIEFASVENVVAVFQANDYMLIPAFVNSAILTVVSVTIMVRAVGDDRLGPAARRPGGTALTPSSWPG